MKILIFANGVLPKPIEVLPAHDMLIAADGGAKHAWDRGRVPDLIIGDLDSLSTDEVANFDRAGAGIFRFPHHKDKTDLELALNYAKESGATEIMLYGLLGGRWDMSLTNILILAAPRYAGIRITVFEGDTELHLLREGTLRLNGRAGDMVSVIPISDQASGLTYQGLKWPLENADLPFGSTRGVSNEMIEGGTAISLREGIVLVVHKKNEEV